MFADGKNILLFLTDKVLAVYSEDVKLNDRIEFPSKVYSDLKILDREKFKELVVELLARTNLRKQKAILALGESAVFVKSGDVTEDSDEEVLIEQFENAIPFEAGKVGKLEIHDGALKLIGANREVYETIIEASKIFEWSIKAVVPVSAFGTTERETTLTPDEVASLLGGAKEIKEADLLAGGEVKRDELFGPKKTLKIQYKLLFLVVLIAMLLGALFFARSFFNNLKTFGKHSDNFSLQSINIPSSSPSVSPSPASSSAQEKKDIKVEVLNGTGISGQAAQVKTLLEGLGYTNITLGNSQTITQDTLLETTASFSGTLKDEITNSLKKDFSSVKLKDLQDQSFDVLIVTGN